MKTIIAIVVALIGQWIVGFLFKYSMRLAPTLLGVYVGYYLSVFIIVAVNGVGGLFATAKASADQIDPLMSYVYEFAGCGLGALIGYCYSAAFIMLVQTFLSAYFIVRGSTLFVNLGFPNEVQLLSSTSVQDNGLMKLPPAFYGYAFVILVLWVTFLRTNFRRKANDQKYLDEE